MKNKIMNKIKNINKIFLLSALIGIVIFTIFTPLLHGDNDTNIIIKKLYSDNFPDIDVYLDFTEGSAIGKLDITPDDIKITEGSSEVRNLKIERVDTITEPINVVLAIDTSGSMKGEAIENAKSAASLFLDQMRRIDRFAIVGFSDDVKVYSTFTADRKLLRDSIDLIEASGETALFDGMDIAISQFDVQDVKYKYLIVLSDGQDTVSKLKVIDNIDRARAQKVTIFAVALVSPDFNTADIKNISESSNGEMLVAAKPGELKTLYSSISEKIRNQYRVTYTSSWPNIEGVNAVLSIDKSGISESVELNYKNPYYTVAPTEIIREHRPNYLKYFDIWWINIIIYFAMFLGIMIFVYVMISLFVKPEKFLKKKTQYYGVKPIIQKSDEDVEPAKKQRGKFLGAVVGLTKKAAAKRGFVEFFDDKLDRAGMKIRGGEFMTFHTVTVIVVGILLQFFLKNPLITAIAVIFIIVIPFLFINIITAKRIRMFDEQLPNTLQLISGSLKAGYSFSQALSMVVEETKPPISDEFRRVLNEVRMGMAEQEALENSSRRIGSEHFKWVTMAINVQREVGGNLAEIMEIISDTIRERERVLNQIKALTSEGKLSAYILIALPILIGAMLFIINRQYLSLLFTTRLGLIMIVMAGVLMITGIIWILKVVNVKY